MAHWKQQQQMKMNMTTATSSENTKKDAYQEMLQDLFKWILDGKLKGRPVHRISWNPDAKNALNTVLAALKEKMGGKPLLVME